MAAKLTALQRLFALEYLVDLNATAAYERAGGSAKTANSTGPRMLQHPGVKELIESQLAKRTAKLELTADRVLLELTRVGFLDLGGAFGPDGQLLALGEMPEDVRRALSGIDTEQIQADDGPAGTVLKIRTADKLKALELLGKHLKLFTELHEHKFDELTEEERAERVAALLDRARARRVGQAPGGGDS